MSLDFDRVPGLARLANAAAASARIAAVGSDHRDDECGCSVSVRSPTDAPDDERVSLLVDAGDCPRGGSLTTSPDCRETVVRALERRSVDSVVVRSGGLERRYDGGATGFLVAAGRFAERVSFRESRLAARTRRDPIAAAHEATGRAGAVRRAAVETGLAAGVERADDYEDALSCTVGPTVARSRVAPNPPSGARLVARDELETGAVARRYETAEGMRYHLSPPESRLGADAAGTLAAAHDALARGAVDGGPRAPGRAVRLVADADDPVETLTRILTKHTRGHGVLDDLFSDPAISDVYVSTPAAENPIRVVADGTSMPTNVRLAPGGAESLASRLRRVSGASFSRADPTLDTVVEAGGASVRVAGVTAPASDGLGFAFRRHDETPLTLPGLVANGTIDADAAALCSLAVERGASVLVAGARGAGKTTFLASLLWELPADVRTVLIEDAPELPAASLRSAGRDVQTLRTDTSGGPEPTPREALHAALRLGDGALAVGEVRGEEAAVLYEAMRVGANASAVLGTIHGEGASDVRERVVSDLGVSPSSFGATDLVVTCERTDGHRVSAVEEVRPTRDDVAFETLSARDDALAGAGPVLRGDSVVVESLARPDESYADVLAALERRAERLTALAETGRTRPEDLAAARSEVDGRC